MNKQLFFTIAIGVASSILASALWERYKAAKSAQTNNAPDQVNWYDLQFDILGKTGSGLYSYTPPNALFNPSDWGLLH